MKIIDISIEIKNGMTVYPGNAPVEINDYAKMPEASSDLSKITFGSHTGTHVDAPKHAILGGDSIDKISLENFIGDCKVFDFSYLNPGESIKISDFENAALKNSKFEIIKGDRVLVKTSNSLRGYESFYTDFVYLDGDAADWLAERDISLFGIDYLSVKQKGSSDNRPHTSLLSKGIPVLEGINLKDVQAGEYGLCAQPLNIPGIDGSPVRAILTTKD